MLTLNDGRAELWQWDTGRTLSVDADCSQVHFSNKVFGRSIDVDVIDGAAIIPDILLQTDKDLNVWAFVGTAENGYTKISKTFKVNRRNKPADYVFTPTDQMTLQTIQSQIGDLADLTTEAKNNLVAAINEAAQSGGGGISTTAKNLLITILRSGVYTDDQSNNITALDTALGGGEVPDVPDIPDVPDVPVVKTYTITRELINVTSNNNQNSISEGAAYMATLTADDGYVLPSTEQGGSISITMGGIDITSNVYNYRTGDINVSSVTGNIVITAVCAKEAELPVNGLDDYFDFRNAELYDLGSYKSYKAKTGNGVIFGGANDSIKTDDKGLLYARYDYSTEGTASWNYYSAPFTFASLTYTEGLGGASPYAPNNIHKMANNSWNLCPTYTTTSGTTTQLSITPQAALTKGYHTFFISIDENNVLKVYVDGDLVQTYSGADYSDFASWKGFQKLGCIQYSVDHATAFATWSRALTEEELSEVERYLRTLEVA